MSKETDLALFGDDDKAKRKRELLDTVNDRLRVNNSEENELTIQDLARKLKIDTRDLYKWASDDPDFIAGLSEYKDNQDSGSFKEIGNRADALVVMTLLEEMKHKYGK
jgi:hypothetical protein